MAQIYCDESGFTGNDLSNKDTPYFCFASIETSHENAQEFVDKAIIDYRVQAKELKFSSLCRYNKGRKAITEVLEHYNGNAKVIVHDKMYNLACKFFEYTFEPVIAAKSSLFYQLNFNRFISVLLYVCFQAKTKYSQEIFSDFQSFLRNKDIKELKILFKDGFHNEMEPILEKVRDFCLFQKELICSELDSIKDNVAGKWILELSDASLASLLSYWGQEFNELSVFCDKSKPLTDTSSFFRKFINKPNKVIFTEYQDELFPFGFNLKSQIEFVDSKLYPGIQIADIFAGASNYILRNKGKADKKSTCSQWTELLYPSLQSSSILPDTDILDFDNGWTQLNMLILDELVERSKQNLPILLDIELFILQRANILGIDDMNKLYGICSNPMDTHALATAFINA